jgi:hypothetical protein
MDNIPLQLPRERGRAKVPSSYLYPEALPWCDLAAWQEEERILKQIMEEEKRLSGMMKSKLPTMDIEKSILKEQIHGEKNLEPTKSSCRHSSIGASRGAPLGSRDSNNKPPRHECPVSVYVRHQEFLRKHPFSL